MAKPKQTEDAATFVPPAKGTDEYDAWLDGPRPEAGRGRGQWLRARQLRGGGDLSKPKAQSRMAEPGEEPERHADDLRALQTLIDGAATLPSDRIRAIEAKQRILGKVEAEEREREHGPLIDLRATLDTLPAHERVAALGSLLGVEPLRDAHRGDAA